MIPTATSAVCLCATAAGENEKFAEESRGERQAGERDHGNEHGEGEKRRAFGRALEIRNLVSGFLGDDD